VAKKRRRPEDGLQRTVADLLARILRRPTIWSAIESAGRGPIHGAILKGKGVKPGWSDILVMHPSTHRTIVLGLELKVDASQSKPQKQFEDDLMAVNGYYEICRSIDDVLYALKIAGIPSYGR